jgi:hypothetical protein
MGQRNLKDPLDRFKQELSLAEGHLTICMGQRGRGLEFYESEPAHDSSRALVLNSPTEGAKVPEDGHQLTLISG